MGPSPQLCPRGLPNVAERTNIRFFCLYLLLITGKVQLPYLCLLKNENSLMTNQPISMDQYIAQLLQRHDKVVVPKLGTFTSKRVGATIDKSTNEIAPPLRQVSFSILEEDEGLLFEQTVCQSAHLDKPAFDEQLLRYVQRIYTAIGTTGAYAIDGVGTLLKDSHGSISLNDQDAFSLLGDNFGLPRLAKKAVGLGAAPVGSAQASSDKSGNGSAKTVPPPSPIPEKKTERKSEVLWWSLMIPLLILFVGLLFLFFNDDAMKSFKAMFGGKEETVQTDMRSADPPVANNDQAADENAATAEGTKPNESVADQVPTTPDNNVADPKPNEATGQKISPAGAGSGDYYVNLGAFSNEKTAKSLEAKLKNLGYDIEISLHPEKKLYRVRVMGFATEQEANTKATQLSSKYPGAWVGKK